MEKGTTRLLIEKIKEQMNHVVIHQEGLTDLALTAILSGGHVLIEGVPGLAKTLWVRTLSRIISVDFKRAQFTPDLMPTDILGTKLYNMKDSEFILKKGPLFTNLFLADEINRTPPKTQSALLEVMEERAITIDGETHPLKEPFAVIATQNPLEFEGTYPLPEALTDRFMMKLNLSYPGTEAEKKILAMYHTGFSAVDLHKDVEAVCTGDDIVRCKEEIQAVTVEDSIMDYIVGIVEMTRRVQSLSIGASPRGTINLLLTAKAYAAIHGRDFVIPDDIAELAIPVLRHRVVLTPEAEFDGVKADKIIADIVAQIKVPR